MCRQAAISASVRDLINKANSAAGKHNAETAILCHYLQANSQSFEKKIVDLNFVSIIIRRITKLYICYIIHSVHSKHCEAGTLETTIINSAVGAAGSHSV